MTNAPPLTLARVAAAAYGPPDVRADGCEAVIRHVTASRPVLAFRGTTFDGAEILKDIVRDVRAWPAWEPGLGLVHLGFRRSLRAIWPKLWEEPWFYNNDLVLTGHSKGAAEATLVAARMVVEDLRPRALVTFGSPRCVLGGRVARLLAGAGVVVRRYRHGRDIVPTVPCLGGLYDHVGAEINIGSPESGLDGPFHDHRMQSYIDALKGDDHV